MSHAGRNPYPRRFGGGVREYEIEHLALLDALAPGWDAAEDTAHYAETLAEALGVSFVWVLNRRLANQALPSKMLEALTTWEEALQLRPEPTATNAARRRAVAAKLRGLSGNTLGDMWAACALIGGSNFIKLTTVDPAKVITYWPGVNPGPPGFEWSSNRCVVAVEMTRTTVDEVGFLTMMNDITLLLDGLAPAWLRCVVAVKRLGFVVNVSTVGLTLL